MTTKTMGPRALEHVLTDSGTSISVSEITIADGEGILEPGSILGEVTATGEFVLSPAEETVGKEGAENASAVLDYKIDATSSSQKATVHDFSTAFKQAMLITHATVDDDTKTAAKFKQLKSAGMKVV